MLRTIRLLALALAAIAFLAACSGAASTPGVATLDDPNATGSPGASPSASKDPQEAMLAYAQCMRDHGVDMPDPEVMEDGDGRMGFSIGGPGDGSSGERQPSKDDFEKADTACHHFLADMVQDKGGPQMSAEDQDKVLQFARCMREHGVDMPDPDFSGGGAMIKGGPGDGNRPDFDPSSDEFQAAQEACQSLLPGGGFKNGGGDGPSTNVVPEGSVNR